MIRKARQPRVAGEGGQGEARSAPGGAALFREALECHRLGRLDEAQALYRKILERIPDHFDALYSLGVVELQRGRHVDWATVFIVRQAARMTVGRATGKRVLVSGGGGSPIMSAGCE